MTTLTINGHHVVTDGESLKITKENPRLKTSDSYSLDVVLPMSAPENKAVFGNINRMDVAKRVATMTAVLLADNRTIIDGIAKVTGVSDESVTLQLIGGTAGMGVRSDAKKTYIDEIGYVLPTHTDVLSSADGTFPGCAGLYAYMPCADTSDHLINFPRSIRSDGWDMGSRPRLSRHPNLLFVFGYVMTYCGYTIRTSTLPAWANHIYIATAGLTTAVQSALPHWTVQEFMDEFEKFFGCAIIVDETMKVVDIQSGNISNVPSVGYDVLDVYDTDIADSEEGNGKMGGNIEYNLSGNDHETDCLSDEIKDSFETREYDSKAELENDFNSMTVLQRKQYFFHCPSGTYISVNDALFAVDQFGMLKRTQSDDSTSLKICPVAMAKRDIAYDSRTIPDSEKINATIFLPVIDNTGTGMDTHKPGDRISVRELTQDGGIEGVLFGDDEIKNSKKEDRMQVYFVDDNNHHIYGNIGGSETPTRLMMPQAFTDWQRSFDQNGLDDYDPWSLALRETNANYYIGQLQDKDYSVIDNAEIRFSFLCDGIPDITQIFMFRNKRYLCSKIELTITERGIAPIKTGYFYELL